MYVYILQRKRFGRISTNGLRFEGGQYCYWSCKKEREMREREKQNHERTPELMCHVCRSEADFHF